MNLGKPNRSLFGLAALLVSIAWPSAALVWFHFGEKAFAVSIFLLGLSLGPCLAAYSLVATARKQALRRLVLLTGGLSILTFCLFGAVDLDLEGFFMLLLSGTMGAAIGHTLTTVILGPVFFGRFLCGWSCWRSMILELLPIGHGPGRRGGGWTLLPFVGLALSVAAAAVSLFKFGQRPGGIAGAAHADSARGIIIAFGIYYLLSIGMALALKDQRAFCKYLCPSSVILGLTSRLSLLKMAATAGSCNSCGACSKVCPMDIDVAHFASLGQRVASGQCILCQRCAHVCPAGALHLTAAFDIAGRTPFVR
ncbi:MAG TPA: 4Fe-4S dicluster domain-containing protein [Candidatus Saccharimonadales bacterium]|nr:4Fe-4S dicluster domain-containing protein [Candidatus Saccharimonadales bacterium]